MNVSLNGTDGVRYAVEVAEDDKLRDAALREHVPGILGECGGFAICGTCTIYVDEEHLGMLPEQSERERIVLEESLTELRPTSRLSCQLHGRDLPAGMTAQAADSSWYL